VDPALSYRHLDAKLRIGEFSLGQWAAIAAGVLSAVVYAVYLHPLGSYLTLASAVYIAGIPALLALFASLYEVRLGLIAGSVLRHIREGGRYAPGPGPDCDGYLLRAEAGPEDIDESGSFTGFEGGELWDS
jgi:hypothetical protein